MRLSHCVVLVLGIAGPVLNSIQAQPVSVGGPAFAKVGNSLYIQSGSTFSDNLVSQFYALDLTTSWTTTQPAWKSLTPGPANAFHTAGYSADNSTFFTFGRDTGAAASIAPTTWLNAYNIGTGAWTTTNPAGVADTSRRDFYAVSNPSANKIYILGGDATPSGSLVSNAFDTFDVASGSITEITTPTTGPQNAITYAAVWVPRLSVMLVIGGQITGGNTWTYNPASGAWSTQATTGAFASNRISPCAASNADGSLVAVFGGFVGSSTTGDANAYILNTVSWTWTTVLYSGKGRGNAACAIIDDTFIVWGGYYNNPSVANGVPTGAEALLLLNLSTQQWQTTYTPSAAMTGGNNGTSSGGGSGSGSGSGSSGSSGSTGSSGSSSGGSGTGTSKGVPTGVIGGIAAGVLVVLVAIAIFLHRRNKKKNNPKDSVTTFEFSKDEERGHEESARHDSYDGPPRRPVPPPDEFSPVHYDFENPPSPLAPSSQHTGLQQQKEDQRFSAQSGYAQAMHQPLLTPYQQLPVQSQPIQGQYQQQPIQNQYQTPYSPHMDDANFRRPSVEGYNSTVAGYSNYSTPTVPRATADEPTDPLYGGGAPYQQQPAPRSYADNFANTGSVYYPPPPTSLNQQQQQSGYSPYSAGGGVQDDNYYRYKVPAPEVGAPDEDQYHDSYGMKHHSIISDTSSRGKRPVSGPQGGPGFGSVYSPSLPGAPQSIPE